MNSDQSKIEQLKKKLYSISEEQKDFRRTRLKHHASQVSTAWANEEEEKNESPVVPIRPLYDEPKKSHVLKRILIVGIFALIASVIFAWYMYSSGGNYISGNNIDIKVIGPVATPGGEVLALDFDIYNGNSEKLEAVDLIVEYPEGTRKIDGSTTVLSDRVPIGEIQRGQTARRQIQVLLFGEENVKKEIRLTVEYRVPGSIILFRKEKIYPIFIGSAPVSIDVTSFKEVVPNQSTTFKAVITSNSKEIVKSLIFKAEYPAGFRFEKASPSTSFGENTWSLGDMKPGDKKEIEITGQIIGDPNIERYFGFIAGTEDPIDHSRVGIKLVESKEKVLVRRPFLAADISLNRDGAAVYIGNAGEPIRGEIVWQNNLTVPVYDVVIEMKLNGATLDKKSVNAERGFYSSQNNVLVWDRTNMEELAEVQPGSTGSFQFSLASLPPTFQNNSTLRRQTIDLNLTIKAKRLSENRVPEEIKSNTSREIKIASRLNLSSRIVRNFGPFENTGPIPPVAERATTYTILHSVSNSFNTVKNVTYKATLPSYVTWLGKVNPESAATNVKYNSDTREITWSLGDMTPGTGYGTSPREFSYQVSITPSISQVGQSPIVINEQRIAGMDVFTESVIEGGSPVLTTNIETDPKFQFGWEKVVD